MIKLKNPLPSATGFEGSNPSTPKDPKGTLRFWPATPNKSSATHHMMQHSPRFASSSNLSPGMLSVSVATSPFPHLKRRLAMAIGQPLISPNLPKPADRTSNPKTFRLLSTAAPNKCYTQFGERGIGCQGPLDLILAAVFIVVLKRLLK